MTQNKSKDIKTELHQSNKKPALLVDVDFYDAIIKDPEVSTARKRELIEVITSIVVNFIDIGFGVHPVQIASAATDAKASIITKTSAQDALEDARERSDA